MTTQTATGSTSRNFLEAIIKRVYLDHAAATAVLCIIGPRPDLAQGSLVFTLSRDNQEKEVNDVLEQLPPAVEALRSFSPVWRKKMAAGAGA